MYMVHLKGKLNKNILYLIFVSRAKTRDKLTTYQYKSSKKPLKAWKLIKQFIRECNFKLMSLF